MKKPIFLDKHSKTIFVHKFRYINIIVLPYHERVMTITRYLLPVKFVTLKHSFASYRQIETIVDENTKARRMQKY